MRYTYLDIETLGAQSDEACKRVADTVKPPAQMKKAETIAAWEANQKAAVVEEAIARNAPDGGEVATHRHKKRGGEYVLIGIGRMQAGRWFEPDRSEVLAGRDGRSIDMREVAVYRSVDDGSLWVRPREEFDDGRFEVLSPAPAASPSGGEVVRELTTVERLRVLASGKMLPGWNLHQDISESADLIQAQAAAIAEREERIRRKDAALRGLLAQWAAFEASYGNQEEAYYKLAKYARPAWEAARAALSAGG